MISLEEMDNTYQNGSKYIDTVAASDNMLSFVEGSKLCEIYKIVDTDHHGYMIDINFSAYFKEKFSN